MISTSLYAMDDLPGLVGQELGRSDWMTIAQSRVDGFADATDDHQWIHVDTERARTGPYGGTIAHGYLTLSLLPVLVGQAFSVDVARRVNYGLDKVRFPQPVPVGGRIRAVVTCRAATPIEGGLQLGLRVVVELDGADKPACVAETVTFLLR